MRRGSSSPGAVRPTGGSRLRDDSYMSVESSAVAAVPGSRSQEVRIMMEDPAPLGERGHRFFQPRQGGFHLIGRVGD